jgi:hypothetical protein
MNLKTLGLTAITLAAAGAPVAVPVAAQAQIQTYYHAGAWDAFSGRNDKGGAVCGIGNTNPADNRRFSIRLDIGSSEPLFSASKPDWTIPDNTRVRVVMQVGLNTPWIEQATGHGHTIDWTGDRNAMASFDQQFRGAASMTLTFPDGNEPPWSISLAGSSAISDTFDRCVRDLTRQVQSEQQSGNGAPPPQGTPGAATQPFSPPPGAPSPDAADAPPTGSQPDGSGPGEAPPNASQPNANPPNGNQPAPTQPIGAPPGRG